jgi:hypothetical protein
VTALQNLIAWLGTHRGASAADLRRAGFLLGQPHAGKFRDTYPIRAAGAVLKVPRPYNPAPEDPPWQDPIRHSLVEIDTVERIRNDAALSHLRKYTAEIYFADRESGLILMKAYRRSKQPRRYRLEEALLVDMFRESLQKWTADYGLNNLLRDENDRPVVVDLGY